MSTLIHIVLLVLAIAQVGQLKAEEEKNKTINVPLKSTPDGELFYIEAQVGRGAKVQTFNLLLSTTYHTTWLPSLELSPKRGYSSPTAGYQNKTTRNDFILRKTGAGYGDYRYFIHNNTWKIGFHTVEDQLFALAYPNGPFTRYFSPESRLDGVLSLAGRQRYDDDPEYLFRNLTNVGLIDHLKFSLYINNRPEEDSTKGALVLGGIDHRYYTGEFRYAKMYEVETSRVSRVPHRRPLRLSSIYLDWSRTTTATKAREDLQRILSNKTERIDLQAPKANLFLDSSTKLFVGVKDILDKIHLDLIGATNVGSTTLLRGGLYAFDDCLLNNKPDFVFVVDEIEMVLTPEDYVVKTQIDGTEVCVSAFKGYQSDYWTFGTRLMRKYYTVFDYETDTVGFATPT